MSQTRKHYDESFKSRVALEAIREQQTLAEIARKYDLNPVLVTKWKKQALENMNSLFVDQRKKDAKEKRDTDHQEDLLKQIGRLTVENEWLKKSLVNSVFEKRKMIDPNNDALSVKAQCKLIGLPESTYYYKAVSKNAENDFLQRVDEVSLERPEYGSRRIRDELCDAGLKCGRKKVRRAMIKIGIVAKYPHPKTSTLNPEHKKYPYLLKNLEITRPNQVWCADITYIRVKHGWAYMVAILDWATRKVLSWRLSNSMDSSFCVEALKEALENYPVPQYFNTDQGSQFTSESFLKPLKDNNIKISMDGKGRALDNVIIERFWRSLKYKRIYLLEHESLVQTRIGISEYIDRYNSLRRHYGHSEENP